MTNPAFPAEMKPQFSGHETFPLRYGWLKKVHDAVRESEQQDTDTKQVFVARDAIARFGVGKNMVASMRYWALAAGMLAEVRAHLGPYVTTATAKKILSSDGIDPWMEDPATLWLLHWQFASTPERTSTWYWVFNHCPHATFDRPLIVEYLSRLCAERALKVAAATLKRDVECFIRTYVERAGADTKEDSLECPLTELGLIRATGRRDTFQIVRGPKATLSEGLFVHALADYWQREHQEARTLSFNAIMHSPRSPGRVFALDDESLSDYLMALDTATEGALVWSETAGMRQLICNVEPQALDVAAYLGLAYQNQQKKAA